MCFLPGLRGCLGVFPAVCQKSQRIVLPAIIKCEQPNFSNLVIIICLYINVDKIINFHLKDTNAVEKVATKILLLWFQ